VAPGRFRYLNGTSLIVTGAFEIRKIGNELTMPIKINISGFFTWPARRHLAALRQTNSIVAGWPCTT
jgi:hypothetical protein